MDDVLVVISRRRRRKRRKVVDDTGVAFFFHCVVDARDPPSKTGPCPRASVEEPIVQFDCHHQPESPPACDEELRQVTQAEKRLLIEPA